MAKPGSLQGRSRSKLFLKTRLLIMSVTDTVQTKSSAHHQPLVLKLRVINKSKKRYNGAQKADSRVNGKTRSKNELVHSLFSFIKSHWSHLINCSSTVSKIIFMAAKISDALHLWEGANYLPAAGGNSFLYINLIIKVILGRKIQW